MVQRLVLKQTKHSICDAKNTNNKSWLGGHKPPRQGRKKTIAMLLEARFTAERILDIRNRRNDIHQRASRKFTCHYQ